MTHAAEFFALARERYRIREQKLLREAILVEARVPSAILGFGPHLTDDPIFQRYRFCNVHREHDKTTEWFRTHVRDPLPNYHILDATVIFRWFNRIETGARILDLLLGIWDEAEARRRLTGVTPVITGSYIIRGPNGMSKLEGILTNIRTYLGRRQLSHFEWGAGLESVWRALQQFPMMGSFMAYEVVSDLRWTHFLNDAPDILTWAAAGPGCARGLGWLTQESPAVYNYSSPKGQADMLAVMRDLLALSRDPNYWPADYRAWEMREVEHWACEYWKYIRARDFRQPPRQRYRPLVLKETV